MLRLILALALTAAPLMAFAQGVTTKAEIRAQAQASMVVSGTFDIEADGTVSSHVLDGSESLPGYVVDGVDSVIRGWRFAPVMVDGVAVRGRALMRMRLLAERDGNGGVRISVSSANFGYPDRENTGKVESVHRVAPLYPRRAKAQGVSGETYLLLKVGRDGRVADAIVEQVNVRDFTDVKMLERYRKEFSWAALAAARDWTYRPPTTGDEVDAPFWSIRTSIYFVMDGAAYPDAHGRWLAYHPGPRQSAPWLSGQDAGASDVLAADTSERIGTGPQLLTPLKPEG